MSIISDVLSKNKLDYEKSKWREAFNATALATLPFRKYGQDLGWTTNNVGKIVSNSSGLPRDAWDLGIYGGSVVQNADGTFTMLYRAYSTNGDSGPAIAESTDLYQWTKPVLNDVTHTAAQGGDDTSNNNLIIYHGPQYGGTDLQLIDGTYYLLMHSPDSGLLYSSTDGRDFSTYLGEVVDRDQAIRGGYFEPKSFLACDPGHYVFTSEGHADVGDGVNVQPSGGRRSISRRYSSTGIAGSYTDLGLIPEFTCDDNPNRQFYDFQAWEYPLGSGVVWACVPIYNYSTDRLGPLELWRSNDRMVTWEFQRNMLYNGAIGGVWDFGLVNVGRPLLVNGRWQLIYGGRNDLHWDWDVNVSQTSFGLASI